MAGLGESEVFRGVSEILCLDSTKESDQLLVLERSATLTTKGLGYGGDLFKADCHEKKCKKDKWLDFNKDLVNFRSANAIPNYEGLAWGPLVDGAKTVLMISDNNFSSQVTELVLLQVKGDLKK